MKSSPLLALPTEVRGVILRYAFEAISHVRLRSPSRRRLRPSRVAKDDPLSILSTCHLLREEAIPVFYSQTTLIFHCSGDAKEYLLDANIDPFVKTNLTHLAMDDGDSQCLAGLPQKHTWLFSNAFNICPSLEALEFRIYSCHNSSPTAASLEQDLINSWRGLTASCATADSANNSECVPATKRMRTDAEDAAGHPRNDTAKSIRVLETQATYAPRTTAISERPRVTLFCYNMMVTKGQPTEPILGDATEAVERRKARVGAISTSLTDYDADSCPDRNEVQYVKELEDSLRIARAAATNTTSGIRGAGRCPWGSMRIRGCIPTASRA